MIRYGLLICISLLMFVSCAEDENTSSNIDIPGSIPGMGDAGGELQVLETFILPEGVTLISIEGIDNPTITTTFESDILKSTSTYGSQQKCRGNGGEWMAIYMKFKKADYSDCDGVHIPRGCVIESDQDDSQSGIVCQNINLIFDKLKDEIEAKIYLHCINKGKKGTSSNNRYHIKGKTNCTPLLDLTKELMDKKIDISEFDDENLDEYKNISTRLQDCVWKITNGNGMTSDDWDYCKRLNKSNKY